jgi:hypothetical protein
MFVTSEGHAYARSRRAERRALWMAEDAVREMSELPLEDALQLVHLYAERGSPKYERAAMRWLERYLSGFLVADELDSIEQSPRERLRG